MAAHTPIPTWIPEDDLILKNAVESGASLEALSKGAVRFSRKFTVRELRDRWHSLLYDPVVSVEASTRMIELELSVSNPSSKLNRLGNSRETIEIPLKRKADSVRSQYYAIRKRMCRQDFSPFDLTFLGAPNDTDCIGPIGDGGNYEEEGMDAEDLVDFQNCMVPPNVIPDIPAWKTIANVSGAAVNNDQNVEVPLKEDDICGEIICSASVSGGDFAYLPDSLLNIPNEDELLFMEVDGKETMYKSSYDGINSLLLNSPNDVNVDDVSDNCEGQALVSNKSQSIPEDACTTGLNDAAELPCSVRGDQQTVSCSEIDREVSTTVPTHDSPQLLVGEMVCTLNTEDPEIPSNDDVFMPVAFASTTIRPSFREESDPGPLSISILRNSEEIRLKKEENHPKSVMSSQMLGPKALPITSPNDRLVSDRVKNEFWDGNGVSVVSKQVDRISASRSHCRSVHGIPKSFTDGMAKEDDDHAPAVREYKHLHAEPGSSRSVPETEANPLTLSHEESDAEEDIPSFSDIETMILEMDLCPSEQDYVSGEVARYQHVDAKRNIMRLEQCAQSAMQRAIAYQGAFAILYGRHLKQYIKKTEVILGRATDDIEVDIDLGKEGRANKISRRQAVIKMEKDGSFILKNIGKSSIFLNGKEVAPGHLLRLNSNSLIEIRDMAFVFEMNHKSVRRFLNNVSNKTNGSNAKFAWSPERIRN